MLSKKLDKISFWSFFVVVISMPFFFLPFTRIPIDTAKQLLLISGLVISIIFWTIARFSDGKISVPRSKIILSGLGIVLVSLISAIFSPSIKTSFFGTMLDTGSFYFILLAFLLMLVSSLVLKEAKNAKKVFWGVLISSGIVLIFQILRISMPNTFSLGIFGDKTGNLIGSWNSFGIFAGFAIMIFTLVLEFLKVSKIQKYIIYGLSAIALFFVILVNFQLIWIILGVFALFTFVYKISFSTKEENEKKKFPFLSFVVVMCSLLFFMAGGFLGSFLPNRIGTSNMEVRPTFNTTMLIAKNVLMKDPVLGSGPNRYGEMWAMYKPADINITMFWDTYFNNGSGLIPTFAITTGILGILAWLVFIVFILLAGFKSLFTQEKNDNKKIETTLFFIMFAYLFISALLYSVGSVLFLLSFVFLGAFIGLSLSNKENGEYEISFLNDPRKSFFSIVFLVILMTVSASALFKYIERFASVVYFQNTYYAKDMESAQKNISKAISLYSNDLYFRTFSQVSLLKINSLMSNNQGDETSKSEMQTTFDNALISSQSAINYNKTNYLNFVSLGSVYSAVVPLKVEGSYEKAVSAYNSAFLLNPNNPSIKLALSEVSILAGKNKEAKAYANEVVAMKPNYVEAYIVLSQISKNEGDNRNAVSYAEQALYLDPQNKNLVQYLNSIKNSNTSAPVVITDKKDKKSN